MIEIKVDLNKHEDDEEYCSPCLLLTDEMGDQYPIILPEYMETKIAVAIISKLEAKIKNEFNLVAEVKEYLMKN
jgi:hypothetical protein